MQRPLASCAGHELLTVLGQSLRFALEVSVHISNHKQLASCFSLLSIPTVASKGL